MTKPHEEEWEASPADNDDVTPRVWRKDGLLILQGESDDRVRLAAAAPDMARILLDLLGNYELGERADAKIRAALAKAGAL